MATLDELLSVQQELDRPTQGAASLDELLSVQRELDFSPIERIDSVLEQIPGVPLLEELGAGIGRTAAEIIDLLGTDTINAVLNVTGVTDKRVPSLSSFTSPQGSFAGEGLASKIAGTTGEFAAGGLAVGNLFRKLATLLPAQFAGESAAIGTIRQLGATTPALDVGLSAPSGAGSEIGAEIGGPVGRVAGAFLGPAAAITAAGGVNALIQSLKPKFGRNINLIDQKTGLPTPALEKAMVKRDIEFGSIIDDVANLPVIQGRQSADQVVETIVRRKLKIGGKDKSLATIRLEQNRIVPDELGAEAVRQGYTTGAVAAAKQTNQPTKREMQKMLTMTRQLLADESKDFRPTDVPGDHVLNKFNFIRSKADTLRKDLDTIANKSSRVGSNLLEGPGTTRGLKGLEINTSKVEDSLIRELDGLGIRIPENTIDLPTALSKKGAFIGSDISKDTTSQRIIRDVIDLLFEPGKDALRAHRLKKQLDTLIDFNKVSRDGLTPKGKAFATSIRRALNETIRDVSPTYAKINDNLSDAIGSMNEFQRVLGGSIDVFAPGANKAIGQDLRGLLSNRKSRIKLENSLNAIDDTARNLGLEFDVNVKDLNRFANTLDDRFGAVAKTSMKGEITSAITQAARGKSGVIDLIAQEAAKKVEKLRGINDKSALNVMQKILKRKESR